MGFTACLVIGGDGGNGGDIYPYNHMRVHAFASHAKRGNIPTIPSIPSPTIPRRSSASWRRERPHRG
jgi:hypothetical protein